MRMTYTEALNELMKTYDREDIDDEMIEEMMELGND